MKQHTGAPPPPVHFIRTLARLGATARLEELRSEAAALLKAFPELRRGLHAERLRLQRSARASHRALIAGGLHAIADTLTDPAPASPTPRAPKPPKAPTPAPAVVAVIKPSSWPKIGETLRIWWASVPSEEPAQTFGKQRQGLAIVEALRRAHVPATDLAIADAASRLGWAVSNQALGQMLRWGSLTKANGSGYQLTSVGKGRLAQTLPAPLTPEEHGRRGGQRRAATLSKEARTAIAKKAAATRWKGKQTLEPPEVVHDRKPTLRRGDGTEVAVHVARQVMEARTRKDDV